MDDMVLPNDFFQREGLHVQNLWTTGIVPYEYDPAVPQNDRDTMRDAMDVLEAVCGIRFAPRWLGANDYVEIVVSTDPGGASWSEVGMRGGRQRIGVAPGFDRFGLVHELMHTLGYHHEHQRPDRDTYVTINTQNIAAGRASQFTIINEAIFGGYDYDSLMHYSAWAFSNGGGPTISAPQPIGNRNHVSDLNGGMLRTHYGAPNVPDISSTLPYALPLAPVADQPITIFGDTFYKPYAGFNNTNRGSEVLFNGMLLSNVTVVDNHTINAVIPASMLQSPGSFPLVVRNPQPGSFPAMTSTPLNLNIPMAASNTSWWSTATGFGETIAITGDLNLGTQREVLVANPGNGSTIFGTVYVMSPETGAPIATIPDPSSYVAGQFGRGLADLGDVDNDPNGLSDFAIGSPGANFGQGRVTIHRGSAPIGSTIRTLSNPPGSVLNFGWAIANVGDLDGDNVDDLAVGAPGFSNQSNAVHLYDGATGAYKYSIQEILNDSFGQSLAYIGGGRLAIGAPLATTTAGSQAGSVSLYQLGNTSATQVWSTVRGFAGTRFGWDLAPAGDVNGDGLLDVAITAPRAGLPGANTPSVMIYSGNASQIQNPLTFFSLPAVPFGPTAMQVANIGDTDGDGLEDLAITDYDDIFVLAMDTPVLTQLAMIPGTSAGVVGGWRGDLAGEKDIFSTGSINLVSGAPANTSGTTLRGFVQIQPVAASRYIGEGCAVTAPAPQLLGTARPVLGQTYSCQVTNQYTAPGSYLVGLLIDFGPPVAAPFGNCTLYVRLGQAQTAGTQVLQPGLANNFNIAIPSTLGSFQTFVLQAAIFDPVGNIDATNGQVMRTGSL